jgi:hypothetical protein
MELPSSEKALSADSTWAVSFFSDWASVLWPEGGGEVGPGVVDSGAWGDVQAVRRRSGAVRA